MIVMINFVTGSVCLNKNEHCFEILFQSEMWLVQAKNYILHLKVQNDV